MKTAGIALLGVCAALVVKGTRPEIAMQISLAAGIGVLLYALSFAGDFQANAQAFIQKYGLNGGSFKAALKITGIAYIAQFAADTCRDCGESAVAAKVELAGRIMMVVTAFPLIVSTVEAIGSLMPQ